MPFYSNISSYYDYIFPYNEVKKSFALKGFNSAESYTLLDIGCGTGGLALDLAREGHSVFAIDSDHQMINQAVAKKMPLSLDEFPVFREFDMRKIHAFFEPAQFDGIICFGNTLVHLSDKQEIEDFLRSCSHILKSGGHLKIQILNYDYILDYPVEELPHIETDHIRFERYYEITSPENIEFITHLRIKEEERTLTSRIHLYPLRKNDLEDLLRRTGFEDIHFYGDFSGNAFQYENLPLLVDAVKS